MAAGRPEWLLACGAGTGRGVRHRRHPAQHLRHEIAQQFGYTPASNAVFVNAAAFPAVFYMPQLVSFAASHGYAVFFITGRPQSQTDATITNLTNAGTRPRSPGT